MLSEKPWKLMDFLVVMALLSLLLVVGIFSNMISAARENAPVETQNQAVNFIVSLVLYGAILALVHLIVRGRESTWRTAFGFRSARPFSALLMALGVTCIVFPIARY